LTAKLIRDQFDRPSKVHGKTGPKWLGSVMVTSRTYDREVAGSTLSRVTLLRWDVRLRTSKPSRYMTNAKVNSAVHPFSSSWENYHRATERQMPYGITQAATWYRWTRPALTETDRCVILYGVWRSVALQCVSCEELYNTFHFTKYLHRVRKNESKVFSTYLWQT